MNIPQMGADAKAAARLLAKATTAHKNAALLALADRLMAHEAAILTANDLDLADGRANGLSDALLDRLSLHGRLAAITDDVRKVATLPDPVGEAFDQRTLDNGLRVSRRRTPLGVIGVIYEARPNVTIDIAALALKTGNAALLRGGKETLRTNLALTEVIQAALSASGLPADAVQYIASPDRAYLLEMLKLHTQIDMIIPRGGAALHDFCRQNSTIPVIIGGIGICHVYVDVSANIDDALNIIANAKTQRPSVCNTLDTLLVNAAIAADFLPQVITRLDALGVSFRADPAAYALLNGLPGVQPAGEADFDTEWMALILGIKLVHDVDEAIAHINAHSLGHSDAILTQDAAHAAQFLNEVDSSAVFWNASTRFNDGGALGLGAEVAVSTQKLHARGPMGLDALTTYKWVVEGDGQVRA
ncbi:MAG: glutamate-5-semialdehyde dehydrogenase [Armatimonadetes bacterium]|nr:glutamate-5-semialdehyde dehydrogenase [Anaerolineae bacterium]